MEKAVYDFNARPLCVLSVHTAVVGSGAAGLAAAERLHALGCTDVAVVTEHLLAGTSRNTGSDKQTYYKLTLAGNEPDSVSDMAQTLFEGGCVDGEHALCEAALSTPCFLHLAELGVRFPQNEWGEYVGYKTDHDPRQRATSVGPYTSRRMTECLERSVMQKNIPVLDRLQVIRILKSGNTAIGLLCLNLAESQPDYRVIRCQNIIWATGGPAGIYADSVYPHGHYGASGTAFAAGAKGKNLTEWQYGLAAVRPRWNVSGTYMQAMPRFLSTDASGENPKEFLADFFQNSSEMLSLIFFKGYEWPLDVKKVFGKSSLIDLLVYREHLQGRRIFLDFRQNTGKQEIDFSALHPEAFAYLKKAGACFGTPYERLVHMNEPAAAFFRQHGVDLSQDLLEIALCAQHHNGGLSVDAHWQTSVAHLYAAGEAAATHGICRPGGSALNAGQVGALRCAQHIAAQAAGAAMPPEDFIRAANGQIEQTLSLAGALLRNTDNARQIWKQARQDMSLHGAAFRNPAALAALAQAVQTLLQSFEMQVGASEQTLSQAFRLLDTLQCQLLCVNAMLDYCAHGGKSRGSALYQCASGKKPDERLCEQFRFAVAETANKSEIQEAQLCAGACKFFWRPVHPIPAREDCFETVWRNSRPQK